MSGDPILDEMLADFPPEERDDPKLHAAIRDTFGYQKRVLDQRLRESGVVGRVIAWNFRRRIRRLVGWW